MHTLRVFAGIATLLLSSRFAPAADAWAFRFASETQMCSFAWINWYDDILFHNTTGEDQVVTLVERTGEGGDRTPRLTIPAGRTLSLSVLWGLWAPDNGGLWVVHLDVPDGVLIRSRAGGFSWLATGGPPPSGSPDLGAFSMPVFRELTPAGQTEYHFGADLGDQNARVNVGLYNAGSENASITVELRASCDDSVIERRTVTLAGGAVQQVGGLGRVAHACPEASNFWSRYVTVTASQPSLAYVANVSDADLCFPKIPYGAAGP